MFEIRIPEVVTSEGECQRPECGNPAAEDHTCPFAYEINDDHETECNCCDDCTQDCADDI